jgi:hypothetical protein
VGKYKIRRTPALAAGSVYDAPEVLPKPVYYHGVIASEVFLEPGFETW